MFWQARQELFCGNMAPFGPQRLIQKKGAFFQIAPVNMLPRVVDAVANNKTPCKGRRIFQQNSQGLALAIGMQKTEGLCHSGIFYCRLWPG